jgi:DNL zinc finger
MSQHLISDNLGFTQQFDGNIEDYFKEKGGGDKVNRVSEDVFNLEKVLGLDTKSGSIFGPDGATHME